MPYSWFKFYGSEFLSDPKTLLLTASERSCWITLLCFSSVSTTAGLIPFALEEQVMIAAGVSPSSEEWSKTIGVLEKFKKLGMITVDNNTITILNWGKRQQVSLTGYERVKRYREKKKLDNANDNGVITPEENRIEKNRIEKKNTGALKRAGVKKKAPVKKKAVEYTQLGAEVLKAFEEVDPKNKTYYANTTQRSAADFLVSEYGLDRVLKIVGILTKANEVSYFPTITSPHDLKEKWAKLQSAMVRKKNEAGTTSRGRGVAE